MDGAGRQRGRKALELGFREGYALYAQRREIRQRCERLEIRDGVIVKIQRPKIRQLGERGHVAYHIAAEVERGEPAELGERGHVAYVVAREREVVERVELQDLLHDVVAQPHIVQRETGGVAFILLARDSDHVRLPYDVPSALKLVYPRGDLRIGRVHFAQSFERLVVVAERFIALRRHGEALVRRLYRRRLAQQGERAVKVAGIIAGARLLHIIVERLVVGHAAQNDREQDDERRGKRGEYEIQRSLALCHSRALLHHLGADGLLPSGVGARARGVRASLSAPRSGHGGCVLVPPGLGGV